ncbi:hypothetical protein LBMAG38_17710 [Chloroflexota bacterium]|nr:hypothetical protein LBMAG38_17710 [Chloroflexota bacterium]
MPRAVSSLSAGDIGAATGADATGAGAAAREGAEARAGAADALPLPPLEPPLTAGAGTGAT